MHGFGKRNVHIIFGAFGQCSRIPATCKTEIDWVINVFVMWRKIIAS